MWAAIRLNSVARARSYSAAFARSSKVPPHSRHIAQSLLTSPTARSLCALTVAPFASSTSIIVISRLLPPHDVSHVTRLKDEVVPALEVADVDARGENPASQRGRSRQDVVLAQLVSYD